MARKPQGPVFLRFAAPLLDTLQDLGGVASASEVSDGVVKRLGISHDELAETLTNGQSRVYNQIAWARFYLKNAGLLRSAKRGTWSLTAAGGSAKLDDAAVMALFKQVQEKFKKVNDPDSAESLPDDEEVADSNTLASLSEDSEARGVEGENGDDDIYPDDNHTPYDLSRTQIITKPMSVEQLAKRLKYDEIDVAPNFQRKADLWKDDKKSRLIESMLIRIPLPVFYFDATDENKWLVIDGLQRLSAIRHFMVEPDPAKKLRLQGLEYLHHHNGKPFDGSNGLPRDLQRRIEETQVFAHLIQPGTPIEVKYNIFKRINTGGLVLTSQEIRNAIYQKQNGLGAPRLLRELADNEEFLNATDRAIDKERMLDCEFILRFLAFTLTPYTQYTEAGMDSFLNRHMQRINDLGEGTPLDDLRQQFRRAMRASQKIFEDDAFRKRYAPEDRRKPINKALFEVWSVVLGSLDETTIEKLVTHKGALRRALMAVLHNDKDFEAAISQGTGDVKKVHKRFSTIEQLVRQTLQES